MNPRDCLCNLHSTRSVLVWAAQIELGWDLHNEEQHSQAWQFTKSTEMIEDEERRKKERKESEKGCTKHLMKGLKYVDLVGSQVDGFLQCSAVTILEH